MPNKIFRHVFVGFLSALFGFSATAGLIGTSISQCANSVYSGSVTTDTAQCDPGTAQASPGTAVVGAGVEFAIGSNRLFDFSDNSLTVQYIQPVGSPSPDLFIFDLEGAVTDFALTSLNPLNVTWSISGDRIGILINSPLVDGTVVFRVGTSTVPEPPTVAIVSLALLALARTRRKSNPSSVV